MNEHTDKNFDNKLTIIKDELIEMSALVEKQLTLAIVELILRLKINCCLIILKIKRRYYH